MARASDQFSQRTTWVRRLETPLLEVDRFMHDLSDHSGARRIEEDVEGADLSGVSGTSTCFVNGRRHHGADDIETLSRAVRAARAGDVTAL